MHGSELAVKTDGNSKTLETSQDYLISYKLHFYFKNRKLVLSLIRLKLLASERHL